MFKFFRKDGRKRFEYATCGRGVFFRKKREKKISFQKYPDKCARCLKVGFFGKFLPWPLSGNGRINVFLSIVAVVLSQEINILSVLGNSLRFADLKK